MSAERIVSIRFSYFSGGWRVVSFINNEEWVRETFVGPHVFIWKDDDANRYAVSEILDGADGITVTMVGPLADPDEAVRDCG